MAGIAPGHFVVQRRRRRQFPALTLSSFESRAYFSESERASAPSSAGVPPAVSIEPRRKLSFMDGSASDLAISALSLATIASGVPFGTNAAYQASSTRPLKPASSSVGTSGRYDARLAEDC